MPRRRTLTDAQIEALLALPTAEPDLIRYYTLSPADLTVIARRRRPHNRLGFAIQLCALRFPGRLLRPGEVVPHEVLVFVADQLDLHPDALTDYAVRSQTRYDQLETLYSVYGFRTFTQPDQREMAKWLLPVALATTSGVTLADLLLEELRMMAATTRLRPLARCCRLSKVRSRSRPRRWKHTARARALRDSPLFS